MIAHRTSKRNARALPQVESTIYLEITAPIMKFVARQDFVVGNAHIKAGETCYAVKSEKRAHRYYIVHYNNSCTAWECSCGQHCSHHDHIQTVKAHVVTKVVKPQVAAIVAQPTMPHHRTEKPEKQPITDETSQTTPIDWKAIMQADRARQRQWQAEYREAAAKLRQEVAG